MVRAIQVLSRSHALSRKSRYMQFVGTVTYVVMIYNIQYIYDIYMCIHVHTFITCYHYLISWEHKISDTNGGLSSRLFLHHTAKWLDNLYKQLTYAEQNLIFSSTHNHWDGIIFYVVYWDIFVSPLTTGSPHVLNFWQACFNAILALVGRLEGTGNASAYNCQFAPHTFHTWWNSW